MESNSINILEQNNAAIAKAYVDLSPEDKPTLPSQRQPSFSLLSKVGSYPAVSTAVSSASSIYNTTKQRFKITAFTDKLEDGLKFVVSSVQDSRLEPYLLQVDQFSVTQLEKIESKVTEGKEAISEKAKKSKIMAQEKLIQPTQHIFEMVYLPSKKAVDATTNAVSTTWRVIRHPTSSILSTTEYVLHTIDDKVDYYLPSTPLAIDDEEDENKAKAEADSKAEELIVVENSTSNDEQSTTTSTTTSAEIDVNDDTNCSTSSSSSNVVSVVQRQRQTNHLLEDDKETTTTSTTTFFFLASSAYNVSFKIATRLSCKVLRRLKRTAIYNRAVKSSYYTSADAKIRSIDIVLLKQQLSDKVQHLPAVSYLLKKYTDATVTTTTDTEATITTTTTTTDADKTSTTTANDENNNNNAQQTYKDLLVTNSKWALLNAKESLSLTLTTFYCTYFAPALQRYIPTNWKSNEQSTQSSTSTTPEQVEATITTTQDEQLETTTIADKQDIATTTTTEESTTPEQVESTKLLEIVQEEEEDEQQQQPEIEQTEQPENDQTSEQTEQPENELADEQIEQIEQIEQTEQPQIEQEVDFAEEVEGLENTFDSLVQLIEGDGETNEEAVVEEEEENSLNQLEQYFDDDDNDDDDTDESNNNNNDVDDEEVVGMLPNQTSSLDA